MKEESSNKIIPQFKNNCEVEQKRQQLIQSGMTKGLTDPQTLKISEEIDAAIYLMIKNFILQMKTNATRYHAEINDVLGRRN